MRGAFSIAFLLAMGAFGEEIISAKAGFDIEQSPSIVDSVNGYLGRYVGKNSDVTLLTAAQEFLRDLHFVKKADCRYIKAKAGALLQCDIAVKRLIKDIVISGLPASLLERELRRRLPIQQGQMVRLGTPFADSLAIAKARVETFLKKNGFFGARVDVSDDVAASSASVVVIIAITGGVFARVNRVEVVGEGPIDSASIRKAYQRMCLSFTGIIDAVFRGSVRCYSRELERETTAALLERFAEMGYVRAHIRVSSTWIDPSDRTARRFCQNHDPSDRLSRCVDLRVDVELGPKVTWTVNVKDNVPISRNAFLRFLSSVFSIDLFSRATVSDESDETPLDRLLVRQELVKVITFSSAKNIDEQEVTASADAIARYLASKGYANAVVIPSVVQDENQIAVNFDIYAGRPHFVQSVKLFPEYFRTFFSDKEMSDLMETRSIIHSGYLSYQKIDLAKDRIAAKLKARGFDPKIKPGMVLYDGGGVHVTFYIESPPRETIDEMIVLNGSAVITEAVLPHLHNCDGQAGRGMRRSESKLCSHSSLVREKIEDDAIRIADHYMTNAFLYAKVKGEVVESPSGLKLVFKIYDSRFGENSPRPLERQVIKDIIISGNRTTSSAVIKRLFPKRGRDGTLDPIALKRGLANLREAGRFSRIDHKILAGEEGSDDAYFLMHLVERPSLSIDASLSFSTDKFFMVEGEVEEINLFSSMIRLNTSLGLGLFWGRQSMFKNKLIWPFIWGKPIRLVLHAPLITYDDLTNRPEPTRRLRSKVSFGLEWRLNANLMFSLRYGLVHNLVQTFSEPFHAPSFSEQLQTLDGLISTIRYGKAGTIYGVLRPGLSYIHVDNPIDPRSGLDLSVFSEFAGGPFLGSTPFVNIGTQNRFFIPVGPLTLALHATLMRSFIRPSVSNWEVISGASSMDSLGGDRSVRGYGAGEIGIYDIRGFKGSMNDLAGYLLANTSVEARFPIFGNFSGAVFSDQGLLIPCAGLFSCIGKSAETDGFGLSFGAALRYNLPVGPISLEYGFSPLTGTGRFHLLFGYAF